MTKKGLEEVKARVFAKNTANDIREGYATISVQRMLDLVEACEARIAKLERVKELQATVIRHDLPKKQFVEKEKELAKELNDE